MRSVASTKVRRAAVSLGVLMLLACVGSEPRQEAETAELDEAPELAARPGAEVSTADRDTVQPVGYSIFEETIVSQSPRRRLARIVVLEAATRDELGKTLRVALDSLGRTDSSTVAVRGILYLVHATDRRRGNLVPAVWGEWIPPEGWDSASTASRTKPYRTYIYYGQPGWDTAVTSGRETSDG